MNNKALLITGASSDIGCELIRQVADEYKIIYAHYCNSLSELEKLRNEIGDKMILIQSDFSEENGAKKIIDKIDEAGVYPNHIIHLPAPKAFNKKFHKGNWSDYSMGINTSLKSIVEILEKCIPHMSKEKYGKIIFMLTSCTLNNPPKYQSSYVTIKYALLGLMKSLSVEYAEKGIMVNGISPDMIETKFLSEVPDLIVQQNAQNSPLGRNLCVSDVIPAFRYLLSEGGDTVTGQNLGITGGK